MLGFYEVMIRQIVLCLLKGELGGGERGMGRGRGMIKRPGFPHSAPPTLLPWVCCHKYVDTADFWPELQQSRLLYCAVWTQQTSRLSPSRPLCPALEKHELCARKGLGKVTHSRVGHTLHRHIQAQT